MKVADVMTRQVVTVPPMTTIADAAGQMLQHSISGLPVVDDDGFLLGIVTEGDLLRRSETGTERRHKPWLELLLGPGRLAQEYIDAHAQYVSEVMTRGVISVAPDAPLSEVVRLMERHNIKRLPVLEAGKLVGIVSRANLVRALLNNLPEPAERSDPEIRDRLLAEIAKQPWGPRASVAAEVTGGVVELTGAITDDRERVALRVLAEGIPGVKAVRDRLVWIETTSGLVISPNG
jgi:CBS domain-containing protein